MKERRSQDLEAHIRESYGLVREYEELLRLEADPLDKARARRRLEQQWELIDGHLEELRALLPNRSFSPDVEEIARARRRQVAGRGEQEPGTATALRVFLNYRRIDSSGHAGRLYDWLARRFGDEHVFMDCDTLAPGQEFMREIEKALERCDAFLALIGSRWLTAADEKGRRRLSDPQDPVRQEILLALERARSGALRLVPVLLDGTPMPVAEELPEPLRPLFQYNASFIHHRSFQRDVEALIDSLTASRRS